MNRIMVRYMVKADRAAENEGFSAKVLEQLKRDRPAEMRYASFN